MGASRTEDQFLVIRVWFEGPDRRAGFRARLLPGPATEGAGTAVASPEQVVRLVEEWLTSLLGAGERGEP